MIAEKASATLEVFVGLCRRFVIFPSGFGADRRRKAYHRAVYRDDGEPREFTALNWQKTQKDGRQSAIKPNHANWRLGYASACSFVAMLVTSAHAKASEGNLAGNSPSATLASSRETSVSGSPSQRSTNQGPSEERLLTYAWADIWKSAVRYLRVERGFTVVEKDEAVGFVLFHYPLANDRSGTGSVELVEVKQGAHVLTRVVVRLNQGPLHLTFAIAEGIVAKLKQELGPPPSPMPIAPPTAPKPAPTPPADSDSSD